MTFSPPPEEQLPLRDTPLLGKGPDGPLKETIMNYLRAAIPLLLATVSAAQTFSVLYNFGANSNDPQYPANSGVIAQGWDGNLYSTSPLGGAGLGTVFEITLQGTLSVLYNFDSTHGAYPPGGLTLGLDGDFYGTTPIGGATGHGTVFKITGNGSLAVLHSFNLVTDGAYPNAPPVQGKDGNFYGTTTGGGTGLGTVYKITPSGKLITLHQFAYSGSQPADELVFLLFARTPHIAPTITESQHAAPTRRFLAKSRY